MGVAGLLCSSHRAIGIASFGITEKHVNFHLINKLKYLHLDVDKRAAYTVVYFLEKINC